MRVLPGALLSGLLLTCAFAADPIVEKAVQDAQKKYPPGDYDRGFRGKSAYTHVQLRPIFEVHAVAPAADATTMLYSYAVRDNPTETLPLEKEVLLDENSIKAAWVEHNSDGEPFVRLLLTPAGTQKFAELTERQIGRRIGFVYQGRLIWAPVVRTAISGGEAMVTAASEEEAAEMAAKLNPGADSR